MTQNLKTDVLIIGGSIAGLAAAITAKENDPKLDVLVVEKYTTGYSGKANRGAGIMAMRAEYTSEQFMEYQISRIGKYLNDQTMLRVVADSMNDSVMDLDRWSNGKFDKDETGAIRTLKWRSLLRGVSDDGVYDFDQDNEYPWRLAAIDLDYLLEVRKYAIRLGISIVDRIGVTDLTTDENGITGAVGFGIDTCEKHVFTARAIVLATGAQNYRIMPMWSPGRGEGTLMAWRVGASLANGEFCSFYNWMSPHNFESEMGAEYGLYNDKGENVGLPHTVEPHPDIDQDSLAEYYKQMKAGNGPMHYHPEDNIMTPYTRSMLGSDAAYYKRPYTNKLWGKLIFNAASQTPDDLIIPGLIAEYSALQVGLDMMTRVPGLFAAGDICYAGTRGYGAVPVSPGRIRGNGLGFAVSSGWLAGPNAARYAADARIPADNTETGIVTDAEKRFTAPMSRTGDTSVNEFVLEIQKVMQPLGNSLYRHETRMKRALERIIELKDQTSRVDAKNPHHLFGANEIDAMLLCAEMFFRASLERRESIGWFLREDYPDPPKELQWIVVENDGGSPKIKKERVPVETYQFKPEQA